MNLNKQFQMPAKELGVGLLKCGMILKYYLYMMMAIEESSVENVLMFVADSENGTSNLQSCLEMSPRYWYCPGFGLFLLVF